MLSTQYALFCKKAAVILHNKRLKTWPQGSVQGWQNSIAFDFAFSMVVWVGVFCLFALSLLQFLKFVTYCGSPDGCESKENWHSAFCRAKR